MRFVALLCGAAALLAAAPKTYAFAPLCRPLGLRCPRLSLASSINSRPTPENIPGPGAGGPAEEDAGLREITPSKLTSWVETGEKAVGKEWNGKPRKTTSKPVSAKRLEKMEREDPEYQVILSRQRVPSPPTLKPKL